MCHLADFLILPLCYSHDSIDNLKRILIIVFNFIDGIFFVSVPAPIFQQPPSDISVGVGSDVYIQTIVINADSVSWYKNSCRVISVSIYHRENFDVASGLATLSITKTKFKDEGPYQCIAEKYGNPTEQARHEFNLYILPGTSPFGYRYSSLHHHPCHHNRLCRHRHHRQNLHHLHHRHNHRHHCHQSNHHCHRHCHRHQRHYYYYHHNPHHCHRHLHIVNLELSQSSILNISDLFRFELELGMTNYFRF